MVLFLFLSTVSASEPEGSVDALCPATAESVETSLAATFAAYGVDGQQYLAARDRVFTQLDCVTEILPPAVAADVHAVMALDAFIARRPDEEVQAALRAYASVRPEAPLAERITLQAQLAAAATQAVAEVSEADVPLPENVSFWLDGTPSTLWSERRPAIVQATAVDGSERIWTDRIPLGGPLPAPPDWTDSTALVAAARAKRRATIWWGSAGVSALATGGLWWTALRARSDFDAYANQVAANGPLPESQRGAVEATAPRANRLGVAAQVFSGATLGLSAVALTASF